MGSNIQDSNIQEKEKNLVSFNPNNDSFNFDLWANEVRRQMVAAISKRLNSDSVDKCQNN